MPPCNDRVSLAPADRQVLAVAGHRNHHTSHYEDIVLQFTGDAPLLVFGGPYSNARATQALMREAARLAIPPRRVICTGDIVAYCGEPEETARAIRDWGCHAIQGNCEEQLAVGAADCGCNFEEGSACDLLAKGWYPFALGRLSPDLRQWMGNLPGKLEFTFAGATFLVVHGGNAQINRWVFRSQKEIIAEELAAVRARVVIAGHCGLPFVSLVKAKTWFNPGVIGMPANDGTTDVWYGLIRCDQGRIVLSTHRLRYDHLGAAAALRRHGHANGYARTLLSGIWPSFDVLPDEERGLTGVKLAPLRRRLPAGQPQIGPGAAAGDGLRAS